MNWNVEISLNGRYESVEITASDLVDLIGTVQSRFGPNVMIVNTMIIPEH